MKKEKKMLICICLVMLILLIPTSQSYALSDLISGADSFITKGVQAPGADDTLSKTSVVEMSNKILGVLIPLGSVVAVLMAAYLGIKFMTGGAEDKANVKEMLIPYVVGCIVVFGGFTMWKLVVEVLGNALG